MNEQLRRKADTVEVAIFKDPTGEGIQLRFRLSEEIHLGAPMITCSFTLAKEEPSHSGIFLISRLDYGCIFGEGGGASLSNRREDL